MPIRKAKNSRAGRPPPDGAWRVIRPKFPPSSPAPPRPRLAKPPPPRYNTLRQPKLFYLKGFLGVVARGAHASGKECVGEGGRGGVCLLEEECVRVGGTPSLPCKEGYYATCCLAYVRGCGGKVIANRTHWTQPAHLSGGTTCILRVPKISTAICYIRLDFHVFQLAPPTEGRCERDHLALSGQNINAVVPTLCGTNSGQHLYVGVGRTPGPLELVVTTVGEEPGRRWEIEVTQVACGGEGEPPDGCLQYYASPQGSFATFNYLPDASSQYLNNLNYVVCVARAPAFCSITYSAGDKMDNATFQMLNFNIRNNSTNGPFLVQVMSDSQFTGRGFNLTYHQNPC